MKWLIDAACSLLILVLGAGSAVAQTQINKCTTITDPGSYVLTKDIVAGVSDLTGQPGQLQLCIGIAADFVTLDLADHTITGPGGAAEGVGIGTIGEREAISIRSGSITNFPGGGFYSGAMVLFGNGMIVERVRAINNGGAGIVIPGSSGHRVVGNVAVRNGGYGIVVGCPSVVLQNVAAGNGALPDIQAASAPGSVPCTLADNSPAP